MKLLPFFPGRAERAWARAESALDLARHESRPLSPDNLYQSTKDFIEGQNLLSQMQADALRHDDWEPDRRRWLEGICRLHGGKVAAAARHFKETNQNTMRAFRAAKEAAATRLTFIPQVILRTEWSWRTAPPKEKAEQVLLWVAGTCFACLMTWTLSRMLEGTPLGKMPWALAGIPLLAALQIFIAKAGSSALIESAAAILTPAGRAKLKLAFGLVALGSLTALGVALSSLSATATSRLSLAQAAAPSKGVLLGCEIACEICACAFIVYRRWKLANGNRAPVANPEWEPAQAAYERWREAEAELGQLVCLAEEATAAVASVSEILVDEYLSEFRRRITQAQPLPRPVVN